MGMYVRNAYPLALPGHCGICINAHHRNYAIHVQLHAWFDSLEANDWITAALAAVALLLSACGLLYARRASSAANRSATEAGRSADAAERQAEATERQATAAEATVAESASQGRTDAAIPPPEPVTWRLWQVTRSVYRLRNLGSQDAIAVNVVGIPEAASELVRFPRDTKISAGHAADVTILRVDGLTVDSLQVAWGDGQQTILPLED